MKDNILWDQRYTYDLKKLPDFQRQLYKNTRGWITRRRLSDNSCPKNSWQVFEIALPLSYFVPVNAKKIEEIKKKFD